MSVARRPRAPRPLHVVLTAVLALSVLGGPGLANAEDSTVDSDTVVGELVQAWPEHKDPEVAAERADDGPLTFIRTASGDSVRVATDDVDHVPVGSTVEVTVGRSVADEASREDGYERARDVLATEVIAPPATTSPAVTPVNHQVSVVMAVPAGGVRDSTTLSEVVDAVNGPVADFWSAESNGIVNVGVTATRDWVDLTVGCTDPFALWNAAAQAVNFQPGAGKHLLVYVTSAPAGLRGCSDGLGTVGTDANSGGYTYVRDAMPSIIAHELGHNVGLGHSSALQCDGTIQGFPCQTTPYWDLYDVMGASWGQMGSLNVVQASRIYNVAPKVFEPRSAPETVTLAPVSQRAGVRAIVLRDSDWTRYWLEYRPASGRDSWLGTPDNWADLQPGVLLRKQSAGDDTSLLMDATPSPMAGWDQDGDVALSVGTPIKVMDTFLSGGGAFVVTVVSVSASGATVQVTPTTPIGFAHQAAGGDAGLLGTPTSDETCVDRLYGGRYCERTFQHGGIYWNLSTGAHRITEPVFAPYVAAGGARSNWGLPTTDTACGRVEGGCVQTFQYRVWATSPGTGGFGIQWKIEDLWLASGGEAGSLGYPLADMTCSAADACRQPFQRGMAATSPATGTYAVRNDLAAVWAAQGYETGPLGFPVTGLICGLKDGGCGQVFQGGRIYAGPGTGAHAVSGAVQSAWIAQGAEVGRLGYPTGDQACGLAGGGCKQDFQGGTVASNASTGAYAVSGDIGTAWVAAGGEGGALGYPTTGLICGLKNGGCGQVFQGGRIYSVPGAGAHAVVGVIQGAWIAQGAEAGRLGYATGDQVCGLADGGCKQEFQGGRLYSSTAAGTRAVSGAIATAWTAGGAEGGALGYPTTGLICGLKDGGCGQIFQGGRIYDTASTGAHPLTGAIYAAWMDQGWEVGPLGYATGDQVCGLSDGGCKQDFQGGTLYQSGGSVRAVPGALAVTWRAAGAEGGPLGAPTTGLICGLRSSGCGQVFTGGRVYSTPTTGTHAVSGDIHTAWIDQGFEVGTLGYPTTGLICGLKDGGCGQVFQGGRIYSGPGTGAHAVSGAVQSAWIAQGAETGRLGYPTGDQVCGLAESGCKQAFQGGTLYSSRAGTYAVPTSLGAAHASQGGEGGALGYPTTGLICGLKEGGCGQVFQGGRIYDTVGTGAHAVVGAIQGAWIAQGAETGRLGYATGDQVCGLARGGCKQEFQGGALYSLAGPGTHALTGPIAAAWASAGGEGGALGYPTTGLICGLRNGGCGQVFEGGRIYTTLGAGTHPLSGPIHDAWVARGGENGSLGYAVSDAYAVPNGFAQDFERGRLTLDVGTGVVTGT